MDRAERILERLQVLLELLGQLERERNPPTIDLQDRFWWGGG